MVKDTYDESSLDNEPKEDFKLEPLSDKEIDNVVVVNKLVKRILQQVDYTNQQIVSQHDGYSKILLEVDNLRHHVQLERGGGQVTESIMINIAALSIQYALDQCQYQIENS